MRGLSLKFKGVNRLVIILAIISLAGALPLLSIAQTQTTTIVVTNSSNQQINHVYFSPLDNENWGVDQLNGAVIKSGDSYTLTDAACDGSGVKVITEDQKGCFLYQSVACGGNTTWNIASDAVPDCGN